MAKSILGRGGGGGGGMRRRRAWPGERLGRLRDDRTRHCHQALGSLNDLTLHTTTSHTSNRRIELRTGQEAATVRADSLDRPLCSDMEQHVCARMGSRSRLAFLDLYGVCVILRIGAPLREKSADARCPLQFLYISSLPQRQLRLSSRKKVVLLKAIPRQQQLDPTERS